MKLPLDDFEKFIDVETPLEDPLEAIQSSEKNVLQVVEKQSNNITLEHPEKIYGEIAKLAQMGNEVLTLAKYSLNSLETPDGETLSSVANIMNSVRDTLKEFSKLHEGQINHQRKLELERMKFEHKKELLKMKTELINPAVEANINDTNVPFNQEQIIKLLAESKD